MSDEPTAKPTLDTLLEMMRETREEARRGFAAINVRLDRIEGLASTTRGEMLGMRADFTELCEAIKEHFPSGVK